MAQLLTRILKGDNTKKYQRKKKCAYFLTIRKKLIKKDPPVANK